MLLFVFLGNIGKQYELTRHNAGFLFGEHLRKAWNFGEWKEMPKFFGRIAEGEYHGEKIIFLEPETFMNLSGKAVVAVKNFYKIPTANITLFYDDKDLEFGTLRFREKGSSAGHRGVADCIAALGTEEIQRWKIGIDTPERLKFENTADFVLAKFSKKEQEELGFIFKNLEEELEDK